MNIMVCNPAAFAIGDGLTIELRPRWWRHPILWLRYKLRKRTVLVVTAVDHATRTITLENQVQKMDTKRKRGKHG